MFGPVGLRVRRAMLGLSTQLPGVSGVSVISIPSTSFKVSMLAPDGLKVHQAILVPTTWPSCHAGAGSTRSLEAQAASAAGDPAVPAV